MAVTMADYQYGLNCIVAKVKSSYELDLMFVLNRKQYTVPYRENKGIAKRRNLVELLKLSDALKASVWNVPCSNPGSETRAWYVTGIWNPNISGMEKVRLPEPTISIVCKVTYSLGKEFIICAVGKHFINDIIVLPLNLIHPLVKIQPRIGDYLLVFALLVREISTGNEKVARLVPLWAHWDSSDCSLNSIAHLNIVECGPENSALLIPDQIPCMWGVVEDVFKKSLKAYVSCIGSSISVPVSTIYQYSETFEIVEGDWIQLWLNPQVGYNRISETGSWVCVNCCWYGARGKKTYEQCLQQRLISHYTKHSLLTLNTDSPWKGGQPNKPLKPAEASEVGIGKVLDVKEKCGLISCNIPDCKKQHVFHFGLMTVYGVKMANIKSAKLKNVVTKGSDLRYRMSTGTHNLRTVWVGPEVVSFKDLKTFVPQLTTWMKKRNLDGAVVKEMMKEVMKNFEAASNTDSKSNKVSSSPSVDSQQVNNALQLQSDATVAQRGSSSDATKEAPLGVQAVEENNGAEEKDAKYTKEEEEEIEKLWWSEDSEEESVDEYKPVFSPASGQEVEAPQATNGSAGDVFGAVKKSEPGSKDSGFSPNLHSALEDVMAAGEGAVKEITMGASTSDATHRPQVDPVEVMPEQPKREDDVRNQDGSKAAKGKKSAKGNAPMLMVVLMELTKFLLEKGKVASVADACEESADFVSRLEAALDEGNLQVAVGQPPVHTISTQTEISGPVRSSLSFGNVETFL